MTSDEQTFLEWIFGGIATGFSVILWWMWDKLVSAVAKTNDEIDSVDKALNDHRVYSADNYIKKDVVDRIHSRIDGMVKDVGDIKNILIQNISNNKP